MTPILYKLKLLPIWYNIYVHFVESIVCFCSSHFHLVCIQFLSSLKPYFAVVIT